MKLRCSEHIDARDWDDTVSRLGGSIFHSSVWAAYSQAVETNLSPLYVTCISDHNVVVGAALAFVEKSNNMIRDYFSKQMFLYATPAVKDDNTILVFFLSELERYCRAHGFVRLGISSYASPDISKQLCANEYALTRRFEFTLALDQTEEQLWRGMSATLRKNINKAGRTGVIIHDLPVEDSIDSLEKLGRVTADRILNRKGVDLHPESSNKFKKAMLFSEAGLGRFISAVIDGEIVSTSLFALFNGTVCHMLAGANEKALRTQASKLLLWHTIVSYRAEGARIFNLGGCKADATTPDSSEHGVYLFKRSFGADIVECANGDKILGITRVRLIDLAKSITGR